MLDDRYILGRPTSYPDECAAHYAEERAFELACLREQRLREIKISIAELMARIEGAAEEGAITADELQEARWFAAAFEPEAQS